MRKLATLAALMLVSLSPGALAQDAYPSRPIRVITQFAPGGPGDTLVRAITRAVGASIGQPFVVDARLGADGLIAMDQCKRAAPDGYTLCVQDNFAIQVAPLVHARSDLNPSRDLVPVMQLGYLSAILVVHPSLPANSLAELLDAARAKPGTIAFGSWGNTSSAHFYIEWLKRERGVSFLEVPYKTPSLTYAGLLAGEVQVAAYSTAASIGSINAGKLKALATVNSSRIAALPRLPTLREAGVPLDIPSWFGLFAPTGTPSPVITRLNAEFAKAFFAKPDLVERDLTQQGISAGPPVGASAEAFAAFLKRDQATYEDLVKTAGVKRE